MSKTRQAKIRTLTARFSPGNRVEWHSHRWIQLVYATSGVLQLQTRDSTWIVPSRRAVWIPANHQHHVVMFGAVTMRTLYFDVSTKVYTSNQCLAVNVTDLMRELIIQACHQGIIRPDSQENRSLIHLIVCHARRLLAVSLRLPMPRDSRAQAAANSILIDPTQSLASVALESKTSLRTLQRIFASETDLSFGRWRSQARLLSALRWLEEGRPVTDVSLDSGFDSLSAFISAFRKFFGVTPGKYFEPKLLG